MLEQPEIVQVPARITAIIRVVVPRAEIRKVMGPGIGELMRTIADQRLKATGPWFTRHFSMQAERFDFEIGIPLPTPVRAAGRVEPGELPGGKLARVVHVGGYDGLPLAWTEFNFWLSSHEHEPKPEHWESYVRGPESDSDPKQWRTELSRPLH